MISQRCSVSEKGRTEAQNVDMSVQVNKKTIHIKIRIHETYPDKRTGRQLSPFH
jgi:transcriptional regulator of met regulon